MLFILILGEMIQLDEHMFQLGGEVRAAPSIWDGRPACGPIEPIDDSTWG